MTTNPHLLNKESIMNNAKKLMADIEAEGVEKTNKVVRFIKNHRIVLATSALVVAAAATAYVLTQEPKIDEIEEN